MFFDELGPPWPKHPCTDNGKNGSNYLPNLRSPDERRELLLALGKRNADLKKAFRASYRAGPAIPLELLRKIKVAGGLALICRRLDEFDESLYLAFTAEAPRVLGIGSLLFAKRGSLNFLDLRTLRGRSFAVRKFRSATEFAQVLALS